MTVVVTHTTPADSTFSSTGAAAWNADHALSGVGTMAEQDANNVAITGGTINNTTVGATTPAAGTFTTLTATSTATLGGDATNPSLVAAAVSAPTRWLQVAGSTAANVTLSVQGTGTPNLILQNRSTGAINFTTNNSASNVQLSVTHTASAVNYVQVTGAATTPTLAAVANITFTGSDTNVAGALVTKGSSTINFAGSGASGVVAFGVSTANASQSGNSIQAEGSGAGQAPLFRPISNRLGSDANIGIVFQSKGTGAIDLAAGSSGVNISNGGTVTALTRTNAGSGYTSTPSATVTAPTTAGGVQAVIQPIMQITASFSVAVGGTGYTVGDVLTASGGTSSSAVRFTVATLSGSAVATVTLTDFGQYTVLPATASPLTMTGGTGSGCTVNVVWAVSTFTITNAGSGYVEQPTVTFSGGGGSGAAAYATVGSNTTVRGLGNAMDFYTSSANIGMRVYDAGGNGAGYWRFPAGFSATATQISSSAGGNIAAGGTGLLSFQTSNTVTQMAVSHTASAVNYVQVTGAATGGYSNISAQGSDTNTGILYTTKGTGEHRFSTAASITAIQFRVRHINSPANYCAVIGAPVGSTPEFQTLGTDTDIDLTLTPKGAGNVRFGTHTGTILTPTGYITIKDSGGTTRRLLVG